MKVGHAPERPVRGADRGLARVDECRSRDRETARSSLPACAGAANASAPPNSDGAWPRAVLESAAVGAAMVVLPGRCDGVQWRGTRMQATGRGGLSMGSLEHRAEPRRGVSAARGRVTAMSDEVAVHHRVPPYVLVVRARVAARRAGPRADPRRAQGQPSPTSRRSGSTPPPTPPASSPCTPAPRCSAGPSASSSTTSTRPTTSCRPTCSPRSSGEPEPDLTLVVLHKGGARGKKVLDALKGSGARVIDAPAIKTDRDKADFAAHEFRRARRKATGEAVHALVEAVGKDVRELAAACQQLIDDTTGRHRRAGRAHLPRGQGRGDRLPGGRRRDGRRHRGGAAAAPARHRRRGRPGADRRRARPAGCAS